jgi:hypothetical protein
MRVRLSLRRIRRRGRRLGRSERRSGRHGPRRPMLVSGGLGDPPATSRPPWRSSRHGLHRGDGRPDRDRCLERSYQFHLRDFTNIDELSFMTEVDFSTDAEGIIFEFGGRVAEPSSTSMMACFTCRRVAGTAPAPPTAARRRGRSSTAATIEGSMNADGGLALMVNGETVSQSSFTASRRWPVATRKRRGIELGRRGQSRRLQSERCGASRASPK